MGAGGDGNDGMSTGKKVLIGVALVGIVGGIILVIVLVNVL